jgi:signal transduction histidine kinase
MNDCTYATDPHQSPRARIDTVPDSIMENTLFFSTLSHELRTPLAAIKGFAQTLSVRWDQLPEERKRKHVEHILRSTVRLERLVADLMLSSRLVDGVSLILGPVDLCDLVAQAVDEAQVLHPNRTFCTAPSVCDTAALPNVRADRDRVAQVLVNLLDNAAKYSPAGEPVTVYCSPQPSRVRIEVHDGGTSLTCEEQAVLFTRYGRLRSAEHGAALQPGSGLGLYICKGLVEAMGGTIGIATCQDGAGNTFWFSLPRA